MSSLKIYTSRSDEELIDDVIEIFGGAVKELDGNRRKFEPRTHPKWRVVRLAIALSMRLPGRPETSSSTNGGEYRLRQVTGEGKHPRGWATDPDQTDLFRAVFSARYDIDFFTNKAETADTFKALLEGHIHRGLHRIREEWRRNDGESFFAFLDRALLDDVQVAASTEPVEEAVRVEEALRDLGLRAEVLPEAKHGPRLTYYTVKLPTTDFRGFKSGLSNFAFAFGLSNPPRYVSGQAPNTVQLEIPRPPESWRSYGYSDLVDWVQSHRDREPLEFCLGVNPLGEPAWINLTDAPHMLLAGSTGSGKSVTLHALLVSFLLARPSPAELQLCLIDPKRVELAVYGGLPHLWQGRVRSELTDITQALADLAVEMDDRYAKLEALDVSNIDDAYKRGVTDMPRIVVVVEELADLVLQAPDAEESLVRLAQKSRASGIHLVLVTQRPDAETFRGLLRSNVDLRVALAVQNAAASRIILDEAGAETLLKPGDMLIRKASEPLRRVHGVYLRPSDVRKAIRQAKGASA